MKIENQVCSLEQSKRLLGLGIECNSFFMWHIGGVTGEWIVIDSVHSNITNEDFPAFSVAELGILLPKQGYNSRQSQPSGTWVCEDGFEDELTEGITEAEARAEMLIKVLENGADVKACNKRLLA